MGSGDIVGIKLGVAEIDIVGLSERNFVGIDVRTIVGLSVKCVGSTVGFCSSFEKSKKIEGGKRVCDEPDFDDDDDDDRL